MKAGGSPDSTFYEWDGRCTVGGGRLAYMDLLALIERREAENPTFKKVRLLPERCLRTRYRFSSCAACSDLCPAGAIQPGKPPTLEEALCVNCRACLPACPVEAFTAADEAVPLLKQAAWRSWRRIELVCATHPAPEAGLPDADAVVRLRGCLAGLGTGTYLALIALGVQEVIVRTDACEACPIGQLYSRIADQTLQAGRLLAALGRSESIAEVHAPRPAAHGKRRVSSADAPALSRRDFLRLGAGTGRALPDWLLKACAENGAKRPSADRRCILAAVNVLAQTTPAPDGLALEGLEFASVSVSREACTACGACARACPTGALEFVMDEEARSFRLLFRIQDCIDCQVCVHVCQPQAMKVKQSPGFGQVFHSEERTVLASGELARCERCGIDFAAGSGERFCSLCNYRRQHPFGAVLPWAQVREHEVS